MLGRMGSALGCACAAIHCCCGQDTRLAKNAARPSLYLPAQTPVYEALARMREAQRPSTSGVDGAG